MEDGLMTLELGANFATIRHSSNSFLAAPWLLGSGQWGIHLLDHEPRR
jgi:hypothetical protein